MERTRSMVSSRLNSIEDDNPLLSNWDADFGAPPFGRIRTEHFNAAFAFALSELQNQIYAIANHRDAPTFENTVLALQKSGAALTRVSNVLFNLARAHTDSQIQAMEREFRPKMVKLTTEIFSSRTLFARIDEVRKQRRPTSTCLEDERLLELVHRMFVRSGASLTDPARNRLCAIAERLGELEVQFSQNLKSDENNLVLILSSEDELEGLPEVLRRELRWAALERGLRDHYALTFSAALMEPFLKYSSRRHLRERAYLARIRRGGPNNERVACEMLALRGEQAEILGYRTFAHYKLEEAMATNPDNVSNFLQTVWAVALERSRTELTTLQEAALAAGADFAIKPWDWRYFAQQIRQALYHIDEDEVKPYLHLDGLTEAAFYVAKELFGLDFVKAHAPIYHKDVRVWEVRRNGHHVGLFYGDYFARESKSTGAWTSSYRDSQKLDGEVTPVVVNVLNLTKNADSGQTLLSWEDARTLFHEFGHALHALLSDVRYPLLSWMNVPADFVELPSQLMEHWIREPDILRRFARHVDTGGPMPDELIRRVVASSSVCIGCRTLEYTAAAMLDLYLHSRRGDERRSPKGLEDELLSRLGMPDGISIRHNVHNFGQVFGVSSYYASGYYGYLWSEMLGADVFGAFAETGSIFDSVVSRRLQTYIFAAGALRDPNAAYLGFRGRLPTVDALIQHRGLRC